MTLVANASETEYILTEQLADTLRELAPGIDRGSVAPSEGYRAVTEGDLLRALVPATSGGIGLSFAGYTDLLTEMGAANAAIALGFNMHNVAIGSLCESEGSDLPAVADQFREWVFDEVVSNRRMFASAASEVGTGAKLSAVQTTYRTTDGGFVLNGSKSFVSLAGVADYFVVTAKSADALSDHDVSHFIVSKDDSGVRFGDVWDGAGLLGTQTAPMVMTDVEIPSERLFLGVEGMSLYKLVREPHWMISGYMGAYLGLARAVVDYCLEWARSDETRRSALVVQTTIGEIVTDYGAVRALVRSAAAEVTTGRGSAQANTAVHMAKYQVGNLLQSVATRAVALCGTASMRRSTPMERYLREAQFCHLMPAKPTECLEYVGKEALGYNMLDARTITW